MAKRPNDIMNWAGRQFDSFGPYLSIETGNPEMGMKGATFWCIHGTNTALLVTNKNQFSSKLKKILMMFYFYISNMLKTKIYLKSLK